MALGTVTTVATNVSGRWRTKIVDIVMPASYTTGGDSLTPATLGLKTIYTATILQKTIGTSTRLFRFDLTNNKVQAFEQTDPAAVGGAPIALPEVASTTNLSTITVRATFVGV